MAKHHKETLNFAGTGYYGALSTEDGIGGFNYLADMEYMNKSTWYNDFFWWCDNGYISVTDYRGSDAIGCAWVDESGMMETANLKEPFSLTSMIAASAWDTNAVWDVKSYTYSNAMLTLKASDTMTISQTAQAINFAKLGQPGDFKNISAVTFVLKEQGGAGDSCSYGGPTYGDEFAFDALKVKWNGKIPTGSGNHKTILPPGLASHHHHATPLFAAHVTHSDAHADAGVGKHSATHHGDGGYHSQLLSLPGHDPGDLTNQFHLPVVEHFGS